MTFDHDWCGVTQLGWDEKSQHKIDQMLSLALPDALAVAVDPDQAQQETGVATHCRGITYPAGGWLCPAQLTAALLALAATQGLRRHYTHTLTALSRQATGWQLQFAEGKAVEHEVVVLANGHQINHFDQTRPLPVYSVAGQVSHIPTTPALSALRQVLCYDGYLTPQNPATHQHCIGASYHRGSEETAYREDDQQQNRQRLIDCFPGAAWAKEVDVSEKRRAVAYAAPRAIICRWSEMCRTMMQRSHNTPPLPDRKTPPNARRFILICLCWERSDRAGCVQPRSARKFSRRK